MAHESLLERGPLLDEQGVYPGHLLRGGVVQVVGENEDHVRLVGGGFRFLLGCAGLSRDLRFFLRGRLAGSRAAEGEEGRQTRQDAEKRPSHLKPNATSSCHCFTHPTPNPPRSHSRARRGLVDCPGEPGTTVRGTRSRPTAPLLW